MFTLTVPSAVVVTLYQTSVPIGPQLLSSDSVVASVLLPETPAAPNARFAAVAQVSFVGGPPMAMLSAYCVELPAGAWPPNTVLGGVTWRPIPPTTCTAYQLPAVTEPV